MDGLQWKTLLKWMIWGYHYFWKHPYFSKMNEFGGRMQTQFIDEAFCNRYRNGIGN